MHPFIRIHSHLFLESPSPIFLICAFAQTAGDTTFLSLLWPLRQTVCCIIWKSVDWIYFLLLLCVQASPSYLHGLVWKWRIGDSYYVRRRHRFPTHHEEKRRSVVSPPPSEQSRCQVAEQTFHFSGAVQTASSSVAVCHVASDRKRASGLRRICRKMWYDPRLKPPSNVFWIWENATYCGFFFYCPSNLKQSGYAELIGSLNKAYTHMLVFSKPIFFGVQCLKTY